MQIVPFTARGVIWYQGESDVFHSSCYKDVMGDSIDLWRSLWEDELPFCCVQLDPFEEWMGCVGTGFPAIRNAQRELAKEKEGVYLVSTSDVGMRYDIHPKKKKPVGERLRLCKRHST